MGAVEKESRAGVSGPGSSVPLLLCGVVDVDATCGEGTGTLSRSSPGAMRPSIRVLLSALVWCTSGGGSAELTAELTAAAGRSLHGDDGTFAERDRAGQGPSEERPQQEPDPPPGSAFNLRVQVSDVLSHQFLSQAAVEVYINYTRANAARTGEDGAVLLHVPYRPGLPIAVVAGKDGYICTLLPCRTSRMPSEMLRLFSSVTMPLLGLNQGNIWLFEDSILITGKTSDAWSQPVVQFPRSLLNLTEGSNVTSVKAFLTVPQLSSEGVSSLNTLGIMSTKSGFVSVELSPVAAVSVQLFSGDTELRVSGPIQISLSVPDSCGLQMSNVVPAWFFNRTTGGWMRKGLGTVVTVKGKLMWTFTAPHLGYWIAAPLSSTRGFFGLAIPTDFLLHHSSLLMVVLGGALVIVICLLVGLLSCRRSSLSGRETKRILPVMRKDQTTSTCDEEVFEVYSRDVSRPQDGLNRFLKEHGDNRHKSSVGGSVIANPNAVAVGTELDLNTEPNDVACLYKTAEQMRVQASLAENLFFYNQPVAILHAPAFFHLEEQEEQPQWAKSATLPRAGASNSAASESLSKDSFTQTLPKGPPLTQNQEVETDDQLGVLGASRGAASTSTSRAHFNLPESASVPGTLNKISDSRHLAPQPPRAWFVSLEGKPAAEIRYAVSEQQRRRRPAESRETSLDSGVDMSELNQSSGRRAVTLERNSTFVKSASSSKHTAPQ
ncbi:protein FAM171B-like isoform X3 [Scophthalmus maximus]|uniref:protein FAM171B-like isoform X3 n=1 Tax=Scophthalmus maximus TaxID=52904 RepID=UPI001FA880A7|nr:protein FAM171B-like isoform X3 [Scophthalmus maximus]